jgi:nicotinamide riboside kinase
MKIALIGAQGVGKTTTAKAISAAFPDSQVVRETVRECPYPCDQNADFKTEWWVLSHSILAEQEAREMKRNLIITDRCLLDISVYTKLIHGCKDGRISDIQRSLIDATICSWMEEDPFDYIFFLKVDPTIWAKRDLNDGFRNLDLGWYELLTSEFEEAIRRAKLPAKTKVETVLNNGTFNETLDFIRRKITVGPEGKILNL